MATRSKEQKENQPKSYNKMEPMLRTKNDLPEDNRMQMVQLCNRQLADVFDLFSQTKQAHWNVKGSDFYQLHELYDELAGHLLGYTDMIAERATALGGAATGTVRMAAGATRLDDFSMGPIDSMESVRMLVDRYASVAASTREAIEKAEDAKDQGTMDMFTEISRDLDKFLWFLEAHIQGNP
jgi:starvation-inducible DNA-binding protein